MKNRRLRLLLRYWTWETALAAGGHYVSSQVVNVVNMRTMVWRGKTKILIDYSSMCT